MTIRTLIAIALLPLLAASCAMNPKAKFDRLVSDHPELIRDSTRVDTLTLPAPPPVVITKPADTLWKTRVVESTAEIDRISEELQEKDSSLASVANELKKATARIDSITSEVIPCDEDWEYSDDKVKVFRHYDRGSGAWETRVELNPDKIIVVTNERHIQPARPGWIARAWRGWSNVAGVLAIVLILGYLFRSYIRASNPFRL